MKFYYLQLTENTYLESSCLRCTKNKYLALTTDKNLILRNQSILSEGKVLELELKTIECKTSDLEFNPDDSYTLTEKPAIIVHETPKYQYTLTYNKHTGHYNNPQKHQRKHLNTRCMKSGKGVKL